MWVINVECTIVLKRYYVRKTGHMKINTVCLVVNLSGLPSRLVLRPPVVLELEQFNRVTVHDMNNMLAIPRIPDVLFKT